jgi:hypothetical protein
MQRFDRLLHVHRSRLTRHSHLSWLLHYHGNYDKSSGGDNGGRRMIKIVTIYCLPSSVWRDIIFGMIPSRDLICTLPLVCHEWNSYIHRSSMTLERLSRSRCHLSSTTNMIVIDSMVGESNRSVGKPLQSRICDRYINCNRGSSSSTRSTNQRYGWCHRVVAKDSLTERWRSGRYTSLTPTAASHRQSTRSDSSLMMNDQYLVNSYCDDRPDQLSVLPLMHDDDGTDDNECQLPQSWVTASSLHAQTLLLPLSYSSSRIMITQPHAMTILNYDDESGQRQDLEWAQYRVATIVDTHVSQPVAYHLANSSTLQEWDLTTMTQTTSIKDNGDVDSKLLMGWSITCNDDQTCLAIANRDAAIIDRRQRPLTRISCGANLRAFDISWHEHRILVTSATQSKLIDIRRHLGTTITAASLTSSNNSNTNNSLWSVVNRVYRTCDFSLTTNMIALRYFDSTTVLPSYSIDMYDMMIPSSSSSSTVESADPVYSIPSAKTTTGRVHLTDDRLIAPSPHAPPLFDFTIPSSSSTSSHPDDYHTTN